MQGDLHLTPVTGTVLLLVMLFCGRQFRDNWKRQAEGWQGRAWIYGVPVTLSFLALALIPLRMG